MSKKHFGTFKVKFSSNNLLFSTVAVPNFFKKKIGEGTYGVVKILLEKYSIIIVVCSSFSIFFYIYWH